MITFYHLQEYLRFLKVEKRRNPLKKPSLSIVIPTFNEKENISKMLDKLKKTLGNLSHEIIFVDDDSPDGTSAEVRNFTKNSPKILLIHRIGRRGLAGAVIEGIFSANSELVAVMDCDLQHDESKLLEMIDLFSKNTSLDIVIGSRFTENGEISDKAFSKIRELGSKITTGLIKKLLKINSTDPLSGFFMVKKETFLKSSTHLQTQGFKILADFLATSGESIEIEEIGYKFKNRVVGESKMSFITFLELIGLVLSQLFKGSVSIKFILFCMVGLSGIFVQLLVTGFAMLLINQFPISQTLGIIAAMTSNYFLNNSITFQDHKLKSFDFIKGLFSFYFICALGALTNIAIATYIFSFSSNWLVSSFIGAIIGAVWNFTLTSIFTWKYK